VCSDAFGHRIWAVDVLQNILGTIATAPLASKFKSLGMDDGELDVLLRFVKHHARIPSGANIMRATDFAKQSTLLLAGVACSYKRHEDGTRQIYSFQYAGDFCDLQRYVLPERDSAVAVQALTDCSIGVIDYSDIEQLLTKHPKLGIGLWRATMLEARILRERLSNARRGSALQRVANLLCEQLVRREAIGLPGPVVPLSQVELADAAALSIVHVNRTIQTLRALNVLSKTSHSIEVIDKRQLAKLAKFDGRYLNMAQVLSKWSVQIE
jgi:CRP-like cAMP-binding protein